MEKESGIKIFGRKFERDTKEKRQNMVVNK